MKRLSVECVFTKSLHLFQMELRGGYRSARDLWAGYKDHRCEYYIAAIHQFPQVKVSRNQALLERIGT